MMRRIQLARRWTHVPGSGARCRRPLPSDSRWQPARRVRFPCPADRRSGPEAHRQPCRSPHFRRADREWANRHPAVRPSGSTGRSDRLSPPLRGSRSNCTVSAIGAGFSSMRVFVAKAIKRSSGGSESLRCNASRLTVVVSDKTRKAMPLRIADHEINKGWRYTELGSQRLLRYTVEPVRREYAARPLRQFIQRRQHDAQGFAAPPALPGHRRKAPRIGIEALRRPGKTRRNSQRCRLPDQPPDLRTIRPAKLAGSSGRARRDHTPVSIASADVFGQLF